MNEAGFRKVKKFNMGARRRYGVRWHRTPSGWFAYWLCVLAVPLFVLTSCAPPAQNTAAPPQDATRSITSSPTPLPTHAPTMTGLPGSTSTPLPATATVTSVAATAAQNLTSVAIKFSGDVQFPEALEKMRQDILYLKGVTDVQVGYGEVDVTFDPNQITQKQIDTVIEDHGYHVQE